MKRTAPFGRLRTCQALALILCVCALTVPCRPVHAAGAANAITVGHRAKTLLRQNAKRWAHKTLGGVRKSIDTDTHKLFHSRKKQLSGKEHIDLPLEVNVVLLGLDGTGSFGVDVDAADLESFLSASLKLHCPTVGSRRERARLCYQPVFNVNHAQVLLDPLEAALRDHMEAVSDLPFDGDSPGEQGQLHLKRVEASSIEPALTELLAAHFASDASNLQPEDRGVPPYTIVVMNPSKLRMMQPKDGGAGRQVQLEDAGFSVQWDRGGATEDDLRALEGNFRYTYKYNGVGHTATWISSGNFVVIDLAAGPCDYGPEMAPSGTVTPLSVPDLPEIFRASRAAVVVRAEDNARLAQGGAAADEDAEEARLLQAYSSKGAALRRALLKGRLATALLSGATHVFMPDVGDVAMHPTQQLLVPVIVLRNHQRFNPLDVDQRWSVDVNLIEDMAQAMATKEEVVSVVSGLHQLAAHPALAVAVQSAMSCRSEAVVTGWEADAQPNAPIGLHSRTSHYLDGDILLDAFAESSELLMKALMDLGEDAESFKDNLDSVAVRKGTRMVPVFVLSLVDVPLGLQFRDGGLVYATNRAVLVLQILSKSGETHGISVVPSGHVSDGDPVMLDGMRVTRHAVAGLATAVCGLPPPYEQYSRATQTLRSEWLWAGGHHPFGPYSNTSTLGSMLSRTCQRSLMLGRTDALLRRLRDVLDSLDEFVVRHLGLPFGESLGVEHFASAMKGRTSWLDVALSSTQVQILDSDGTPLHRSTISPAGAYATVKSKIGSIQQDVDLLSYASFTNNMTSQLMLTKMLAEDILKLQRFAADSLDDASASLACCRISMQPRRSGKMAGLLVAVGVSLACMLAACMRMAIKDEVNG